MQKGDVNPISESVTISATKNVSAKSSKTYRTSYMY